jgi:hypothetical protein
VQTRFESQSEFSLHSTADRVGRRGLLHAESDPAERIDIKTASTVPAGCCPIACMPGGVARLHGLDDPGPFGTEKNPCSTTPHHYFSFLHSSQRGLPPLPSCRCAVSMSLPVLQTRVVVVNGRLDGMTRARLRHWVGFSQGESPRMRRAGQRGTCVRAERGHRNERFLGT